MNNVSFDIINPFINDNFKQKELPSKPIVSIHTRDQRDTMKIIKTFLSKIPSIQMDNVQRYERIKSKRVW